MKHYPLYLAIALSQLVVASAVPAQPASTAVLGSTVPVWSSHTTIRERVDAGVNERIEIWSRRWIVSPSGQTYADTNNYGFNGPDGASTTYVTLNEMGRWSYWSADGGSIDSFRFGDAPAPWYMFPHNPPNGVGYGGAGIELASFIDVQPPTPTSYTLSTSVSGSGSVNGAGSYNSGDTATLTATPSAGHAFSGWQGDLTGSANPATLVMNGNKSVTAVFTPQNSAPTITWIAAPTSAPSGQSYTITTRGHDADGNLTQVNVWKNGSPFSFAGGGNGTDGDSGNATSDTGPATITFTAQAVDAAGATSATISHSISISAANQAPTISWNTTPASVASGQTYSVSAHGHDADGNLSQVNVWKNGAPFSFAGGGNGTDGDSGNPTSDTGPATVTFTAQAVDANGATSAMITQMISVGAPNSAPTISWIAIPGSVASGQSYTISARGHDADGNLSQVNIWRNGAAFSLAGGGNGTDGDSANTTSDTGPTAVTYTAQAVDANGATSTTISQTVSVGAPNTSPTIAWTATPGSASSGQTYTVSARGHDADGNLSQVNIWKNGAPFSFAGGGNGTDGDSGNPTSDTGPATVTFTAQAVDATGATSATITQTVIVSAPNAAPTISWATTPGTVASGQSYTISVHGHDADGNLTQVNIWKNGAPFAFAGGGNGTDGDSSNATSDIGSATVTFTANAVDSLGAISSTITHVVTVAAPAAVSASIGASPTTSTAPGSTTISWTSNNATSVSVTGSGLNTTATTGSELITGLATGTYTYTISAQGPGGPVTQTATVTVADPSSVTAAISASPTTATAPGASTITWSTANATSVSVSGSGLSSTAASGSQVVSGLAAGTYDYTITAQGPNGPATQTVSVTVSAPSTVSGSISASPTNGVEPASTTITWTTSNATSASVSGPGLTSTALIGSQTIAGLTAGTHGFTLTAQGVGGPFTQIATVTISAPAAVTAAIAASPSTATALGSTSITWSSENATSVVVSGIGLNSTAASGAQAVSGLSEGTYSYTITAQGPGGPVTRTTTFTVSPAAPPVTASLAASPTTTTAPGATTLSWTTTNATSVFVTGPGIASTAATGSQSITGLPAGTHTFTLTAQGNGGPLTRTAMVTVNSGASVTASISAAPSTLNMGGTVSLNWSTANATTVRVTGFGISGSPYQTNPNLTVNVSGLPPGQTSWTLVAEGPGGPVTRTATVNVNSTDGLYGSLTTSPAVIYSNQSTTLAWSSFGTNIRWVHGQSPGINGVNVYPAPATGSTTISGLPPGEYSFVFEYGPGAFTITRVAYAYLTVLGVDRTVATSATPAGTGAVTGGGTYREGTSVTLTATADSTHVFSGWSGDFTGAANPLTFTVGAQNYSVVANFVPRTHTVAVSVTPAGAGTITGAASYNAGSTATVTATPDSTHTFTGWSGDLTSSSNPISFVVNGDVNLIANFAATSFALTTSATGGGSVTPGGTYPAGTVVTLSATPDATHRFTNWSGDASGGSPSVAVTIDRAKFVQANFTGKTSQTILFDPPGDHGLTSPPFLLTATASSGLPVSFSLLSGPATLTGNSVQVTGPGPVMLQASQPGDAFYLPAAPVNQTFNVITAATLKYRGQSRTLLRDETTREAPPYVIERP